MFYVIMKFKNSILCHELYTILIIIFQYLMKFIYIIPMFYVIKNLKTPFHVINYI